MSGTKHIAAPTVPLAVRPGSESRAVRVLSFAIRVLTLAGLVWAGRILFAACHGLFATDARTEMPDVPPPTHLAVLDTHNGHWFLGDGISAPEGSPREVDREA